MTTIRVRANVPENRQVTLTLPPEVPVGDAELEIAVREPEQVFEVMLPPDTRPRVFPPRPTNPELAAEHDIFVKMLPELMTKYAGKYIALHGGSVVAVGDTEVDALTRANDLHPGVLVLVRLVTDQPQPVQRIGSPRLVSKGG
jgi:hypothetical protein